MQTWSPHSWQQYTDVQPVHYRDLSELNAVLQALKAAPPLVKLTEIHALSVKLKQVAMGEAFILQAGECAERFSDARKERVIAQACLLQELSQCLASRLQKPVLTIGRIAGQYAKPRSLSFELQNGLSLENYRGDLINEHEFNVLARQPNPQRLQQAYQAAQASLILLREQASEIYTSHEALHMAFEESLTRQSEQQYYNLGTHFPWAGLRTARIDSAHIEYLSGIANPIAIKLGPSLSTNELVQIVKKLNPNHELGRLSLIHRLGVNSIAQQLPAYIQAVQASGIPVLWMCDPMHGNTQRSERGFKFRLMSDMQKELQLAMQIHQNLASSLSGVHLELTSENVYECIEDDGASRLTTPSYVVDPRLNREQALHLLSKISGRTHVSS